MTISFRVFFDYFYVAHRNFPHFKLVLNNQALDEVNKKKRRLEVRQSQKLSSSGVRSLRHRVTD